MWHANTTQSGTTPVVTVAQTRREAHPRGPPRASTIPLAVPFSAARTPQEPLAAPASLEVPLAPR
ncbi:hypothetical protein C6P46_002601 [Rhodotorula mucilaginosa]|uniref:Uncharacterized protein n=1 Tax=Rhodotorula mucilaginosa TaxID=5537 RepID=A0A9P6WAD3_RHOMI|nr:hypothetical protein C6P46_002601 [Rhodotorula mucilaginosa]